MTLFANTVGSKHPSWPASSLSFSYQNQPRAPPLQSSSRMPPLHPVCSSLPSSSNFQTYKKHVPSLLPISVRYSQCLKSACHQRTACPVSLSLAALFVPHVQRLSRSIVLHRALLSSIDGSVAEHKDSLPPLNQAQITKLKYLTIVTLATERHVRP